MSDARSAAEPPLDERDLSPPAPRLVGRRVDVYLKAHSTNDLALRALAANDGEGRVFFAEEQTAGRGRHGRRWIAPAGKNLLFSACAGPVVPPAEAAYLTVAGGLAAAEAVREVLGLPALVRWPNDMVIRGRKAAGVLVESARKGRRLAGYAIGVGLNVNMAAEDFPPDLAGRSTSLLIESGRSVERAPLARAVLARMDDLLALLKDGRRDAVRERWESLLVPVGGRVRVEEGTTASTGRIMRASLDDGLWVTLDSGHQRAFRAEHARVEYL